MNAEEMIMRRLIAGLLASGMVLSMAGCTSAPEQESVEVYVFAAASLNRPMAELEASFEAAHPEADIIISTDSSGILMTQIEEGARCDIFFSAGAKQMNQLSDEGLVDSSTVVDVLRNSLVVIGSASSGTEVEGLETLRNGNTIAICDASVPAGRYTRQALVNSGLVEAPEDGIEALTTADLMEALGVEISEQSNVTKALTAVAEGSCDAGTCYYSDTYGYEDDIVILQMIPSEISGDIVYPAGRVIDSEATDAEERMADEFFSYIQSEEAMEVFSVYYFE